MNEDAQDQIATRLEVQSDSYKMASRIVLKFSDVCTWEWQITDEDGEIIHEGLNEHRKISDAALEARQELDKMADDYAETRVSYNDDLDGPEGE